MPWRGIADCEASQFRNETRNLLAISSKFRRNCAVKNKKPGRSIRFAPKHARNTPAKNQPRNPARIWHCDIIIFVSKTRWRWRDELGKGHTGRGGHAADHLVSWHPLIFRHRGTPPFRLHFLCARAWCTRACMLLRMPHGKSGSFTETRPNPLSFASK